MIDKKVSEMTDDEVLRALDAQQRLENVKAARLKLEQMLKDLAKE